VFPGGKGGLCVRLITYHHPVSSRKLGTLTSLNPLGLSRRVMGLLNLFTRLRKFNWILFTIFSIILGSHLSLFLASSVYPAAQFWILYCVTGTRHLMVPGAESTTHWNYAQTQTPLMSLEPHSYQTLNGIINLTDGALYMKCPIFYNSHYRRTVSYQTSFHRVVVPLERTTQSCATQSRVLS